jgi:hypothetical protein
MIPDHYGFGRAILFRRTIVFFDGADILFLFQELLRLFIILHYSFQVIFGELDHRSVALPDI